MTLANYIEVERALLDAAMASAVSADQIVLLLSEEDFSDPANRTVFRAILDLRVSGAAVVNSSSVGELLSQGGKTDAWAMMADLVGRERPLTIPLGSIGRAAAALKERRTKRRIIQIAQEGGTEAVRDFLGAVREINTELDDGRLTRDEADRFLALIRRNAKLESLGPPTGIPALDRATFGLVPSFLWAIGGATSGGKTLLAVQCVIETTKWGGRTAYFSAEIPKRWLLARLAGAYLGISSNRIFRGRITEREEILVEGVIELMGEWPIHIFRDVIELFDICRRARAIKAKYGKLDLVVVDFVQNLRVQGVQNMNERMALVALELQNLASEVDACILAISQQSNEQVKEKGKGGLTYRYAAELAHAADVGIEIIPPNEIILKKNRAGQTGKVKVLMGREWTRFIPLNEKDDQLEDRY